MNFGLLIIGAVSFLVGGSLQNLEVSPNTIATVPFGHDHISVYKHPASLGRYYAMPLAYLMNNSAKVSQNFLTGRSEMSFDVLLWSVEIKEAVFRHVRDQFDSQVTSEAIELIPMHKIRVV